MSNIETRACKGIEIREAPEGTDYIGVLEGYAAVFESNSVEFESFDGPWVEQVERGAFKRSLETRQDVKALWSHDSSQIIARSPNTLKLEEDERGLHIEMSLVDTNLNRDLLANVRGGNVDSMSFGFEVIEDEFQRSKDKNVPSKRTLKDVELYEVSAVVWPAYPDTKLAERSVEKFLQAQEEDAREESQEDSDDGEQSEPNAPLRSLWAARLGVKTNKSQKGNDDE